MLIITALITGFTAFVRYNTWNHPMMKLGEAARKIAQGDFSVRIAPLRRDGKKDAVEVMFDDFNTMAIELASAEILKSDFIANVSHEIKTPLSVIQGYASALRDKNLTAEERLMYADTIVDATQKLTELVTNILRLSKLENQEIIQQANPFDLGEQLRQCVLGFDELLEKKNIRLEADLDELIVCYDKSMLEIVWNRFKNRGM
jgi:signal transduction histidine kinase